jgi:DNA polymerase
MCAFAGDTGPVEIWQEGDAGLKDLQAEMMARRSVKDDANVAWNVGFERTLTSRVWRMRDVVWRDAMVDSLYAGLPAGLKDCNRVPFFAKEAETTKETLLINKFCKPSKSGETRNRETDPEDWAAFCDYCQRDVKDTRLIFQWLREHFDTPERVLRAWEIDQAINSRGMPIDRLLTFRAWEEAQRLQLEAHDDLKRLTGLDNPNSPAQLLAWVKERGYPFGGLAKELVLKELKEDGEDQFADD